MYKNIICFVFFDDEASRAASPSKNISYYTSLIIQKGVGGPRLVLEQITSSGVVRRSCKEARGDAWIDG